MNWMAATLLLLGSAGFASADPAAEEIRIIPPGSIEYRNDPNVPGVSFAVLSGNPKQGAYTVRVKIAPGARLAPHSHPDTRTVTVIAGTYYFAEGESPDEGALRGHGPGTVIVVPAGKAHFAAARDDGATAQESGHGPTGHMPIKR
jgi:quercetin dioxygenase-like cupin family protein